MVQGIDDILDELGPLYAAQRELRDSRGTAPREGREPPAEGLLQYMGCDVVTVDELAAHSALPVSLVLAELSSLELAGHIERCAGGYCRT